jgi:hypothetical protein
MFQWNQQTHRSGWNCSSILILEARCRQTCITCTSVECTVANSWWWVEKLPETCTVLYKNKFGNQCVCCFHWRWIKIILVEFIPLCCDKLVIYTLLSNPTNLYTAVESNKFVHCCRIQQIYTLLSNPTNLYTVVESNKFIKSNIACYTFRSSPPSATSGIRVHKNPSGDALKIFCNFEIWQFYNFYKIRLLWIF